MDTNNYSINIIVRGQSLSSCKNFHLALGRLIRLQKKLLAMTINIDTIARQFLLKQSPPNVYENIRTIRMFIRMTLFILNKMYLSSGTLCGENNG